MRLCPGPRVIQTVAAETFPRADGRLDRQVTVTRDCGHTYQWGGRVDAPLPQVGEAAMQCLEDDSLVNYWATAPYAHTTALMGPIFDEGKRPTKRRQPRKGEAA